MLQNVQGNQEADELHWAWWRSQLTATLADKTKSWLLRFKIFDRKGRSMKSEIVLWNSRTHSVSSAPLCIEHERIKKKVSVGKSPAPLSDYSESLKRGRDAGWGQMRPPMRSLSFFVPHPSRRAQRDNRWSERKADGQCTGQSSKTWITAR